MRHLDIVLKELDELVQKRLETFSVSSAESTGGVSDKDVKTKNKAKNKNKTNKIVKKNGHKVIESDINNKVYHIPKILQFVRRLNFTSGEMDLFHLIIIVQGSTNPYILNNLVEEDYLRRVMGFQRICHLSEIDIEMFCDSERQHIKEGLTLMEEDNGLHFNIRAPRTAVQIFYGRKVMPEELMKVTQTILEDIILSSPDTVEYPPPTEQESCAPIPNEQLDKKRKLNDITNEFVDTSKTNSNVGTVAYAKTLRNLKYSNEPSKKKKAGANVNLESISNGSSVLDKKELMNMLHSNGIDLQDELGLDEEAIEGLVGNINAVNGDAMDEENEFGSSSHSISKILPYSPSNQLEYLEEGFQIIALMVRGNAARLKDDLKKEGTRLSNWESGADVKHGRRELLAKLRVSEIKLSNRVLVTREKGLQLPRLELLAERLGLDSFEKTIILLLIGKTVSPIVRTLMDTLVDGSSSARSIDDAISVGQGLAILCQDFNMQINNRKYFYRSGRLLTNGIISLTKPRWHQGNGDLTDQKMSIDRRLLDWCVGLDSEINELVEGSDLYTPKVTLSQVRNRLILVAILSYVCCCLLLSLSMCV